MRFGEVETAVILAAYGESFSRPNASIRSGDILDKYVIEPSEGWIHQIVADLGRRGLILGKGVLGDERSQPIRMTAAGMREAESLIDAGKTVHQRPEMVVEKPVHATAPSYVGEPLSMVPETSPTITIDSSSWTGLRAKGVTVSNRARIKEAIGEARTLFEQRQLSNEQKVQALVLLRAAEELVNAPEPPSDIVWELINRAAAVCGIAGLVLTIFLTAVA